jgi:uncharacterized protein YcbK (DUF882 family)
MSDTMITINKTDNSQITKNFNISEFFSKSVGVDSHPFDATLISVAQKIRDKYGVTVVNSTYRTKAHNMSVGGSPVSRHLDGNACDLKIQHYDKFLKDLQQFGMNIDVFEGRITECVVYDTFVHIATSNKGQKVKPVIGKMSDKDSFFF